jgi:hypothetical protein
MSIYIMAFIVPMSAWITGFIVFPRDGWVDSYSSCLGRGVAHLAFRSRQTGGSGPSHQEPPHSLTPLSVK